MTDGSRMLENSIPAILLPVFKNQVRKPLVLLAFCSKMRKLKKQKIPGDRENPRFLVHY